MTMGGVALGAVLGTLLAPRAPTKEILDQLIADKPEFYKFVDIDLSTARTNQVYDEMGTFMWIDNQFARGEITLALNERRFDKFDLRRQKYIEGPFYRFYITNVAGQGKIRLFISRGYHAASEPVESIRMDELAARLGSIDTFDRRGDVLWYDDFESGINAWDTTATGAGSSIDWVATTSQKGGFSMRLLAGPAVGRAAAAKHTSPLPVSTKVGFEASFTVDSDIDYISFQQTYQDALQYAAKINYDETGTGSLYYYDSANNPQLIVAGLGLLGSTYVFHTIKLVIDIVNNEYVRLILDNTEYDLSSLGIYAAGALGGAQWFQNIKVFSGAVAGTTSYIDSVIVTQNEP